MAKIPHSSRYRTSGKKASANAAVPNRTGSARNGHNATDWAANQPPSTNWLMWLVGLMALGLLIAFPRHVLVAIGFGLLLFWFLGKK